jgi:hypothetical protein
MKNTIIILLIVILSLFITSCNGQKIKGKVGIPQSKLSLKNDTVLIARRKTHRLLSSGVIDFNKDGIGDNWFIFKHKKNDNDNTTLVYISKDNQKYTLFENREVLMYALHDPVEDDLDFAYNKTGWYISKTDPIIFVLKYGSYDKPTWREHFMFFKYQSNNLVNIFDIVERGTPRYNGVYVSKDKNILLTELQAEDQSSYLSWHHIDWHSVNEMEKNLIPLYKRKEMLKIKSISETEFYDIGSPFDVLETHEDIVKANDIAFMISEAGDFNRAIIMLNKVLTVDSNRVVAYLNLADSYWGIGDKSNAAINYYKYVELMKVQQKDLKRIPSYVYKRL